MVQDMIQIYLESLQDDGMEIPEPDSEREVLTERIQVALSR